MRYALLSLAMLPSAAVTVGLLFYTARVLRWFGAPAMTEYAGPQWRQGFGVGFVLGTLFIGIPIAGILFLVKS